MPPNHFNPKIKFHKVIDVDVTYIFCAEKNANNLVTSEMRHIIASGPVTTDRWLFQFLLFFLTN